MHLSFGITLATAISLTILGEAATVLEKLSVLQKRATNPCENGGNPELYKEYHGDLCPPRNVMRENGECVDEHFNYYCQSYCEIRTTFTYDVEQPTPNGYCHGPLTCTVTDTQTTTYTYNGGFNLGYSNGFQGGITGGYSHADAITSTQSRQVKLDENQCGYFTFLPILRGSCGSMTEVDTFLGQCKDPPYRTTPNVCSLQPFRSADGKKVLGDTIFVKTDCGTRARLPMDQQDKAYQHEGVAAPQQIYDTYLAESAGDQAEAPGDGDYAKGWCTAHITQYQKNEDFGPNKGNADYQFSVCLYDAKKAVLNVWPDGTQCTSVIAPTDQRQEITSKLPHNFLITAGAVDDDAIKFEYDGKQWTSSDEGTSFGGYEDGDREGDTGFTC
ncbi:MAG: hypothetical protein LQ351_001442 [Letrouitia transgressa]|nr:MAG: hypothetical protein LQ351_001442 [Letrouitia transgressa]